MNVARSFCVWFLYLIIANASPIDARVGPWQESLVQVGQERCGPDRLFDLLNYSKREVTNGVRASTVLLLPGTLSCSPGDDLVQQAQEISAWGPFEEGASVLLGRKETLLDRELWCLNLTPHELRSFPLYQSEVIVEDCLRQAEFSRSQIGRIAARVGAFSLWDIRGNPEVVMPFLMSQMEAIPQDDKVNGAYAQWVLARYLYRLGKNEEALQSFSRALSLFESNKDEQGAAYALSGIADIFFRLGKIEEALRVYSEAKSVFEASKDRLGLGMVSVQEANVLLQMGDSVSALTRIRYARSAFEEWGYHIGLVSAYIGEANILFLSGDIDEARKLYLRARDFSHLWGDRQGEARALLGEAGVLFYKGENENSLQVLLLARTLFESIGDKEGQGETLLREGAILQMLWEYDSSIGLLKSARSLYESVGSKLGEGNSYLGEGQALSRIEGKDDVALQALSHARGIFQAIGYKRGEGLTYRFEAEILEGGDDRKSLQSYRRAQDLLGSSGDELNRANALVGEARVRFRSEEIKPGINLALSAKKVFKRYGLPPNQIMTLLFLAEAYEVDGALDDSLRAAEEAISVYSEWRRTRVTDFHRTADDQTIAMAYEIAVSNYLRQGNTIMALTRAEEARGRSLIDLMVDKDGVRDASVGLTGEWQRITSELSQIEAKLSQAKSESELRQLLTRRDELDKMLEWSQYRQRAAQGKVLPVTKPLDASGIRLFAKDVGSILIYYVMYSEVVGFVVSPASDEVFVKTIPISREDLSAKVRGFSHDLANPLYRGRFESAGRELWDLLISPFQEKLGTDWPLIIVPHGPLHELPFEALAGADHVPMFEKWATSIAPSVTSLAIARMRHRAPQDKEVFVAFTSEPGVYLTDSEAAELAEIFNSRSAFHTTKATISDYMTTAIRARHLLISTRGVYARGNMTGQGSRTESYLDISPSLGVHDSRLSAAEISSYPIQAELVTIASCDTAYGQALLSDDQLNLSRAFLIAGAASVLATRWKVPGDESVTRFLLDFYRFYRQGGYSGKPLRKDEALVNARRASRQRGDPAQVWAAWAIIGDAR
jgi:CHAT domain-containing protein/tetratricopeptide (TPR) repeat protein